MKLLEIARIDESVTFSVAKEKKDEKGKRYWSIADFQQEKMEECGVCHGTGKDPYAKEHGHDVDCDMCMGKGKTKEYHTEYGELNVSNANALAILDMLGLEEDYVGNIPTNKLPDIRRRLIKLKNKGVDDYTSDTTDERHTRVVKQGDMHKIEPGPRMINVGRSEEQVMRYVDRLLAIIDFAQKNDATVVWG